MLESYFLTKSDETDIVVYLNDDDPCVGRYREVCDYASSYPVRYIIGPRLYLAQAYNLLFERYKDVEFYTPINDDHVFVTPKWDEKLISIIKMRGKGWGLAAANDGGVTAWDVWQHPSGCVISGNIPRTLGYMIYPRMQHIGIDDYFQFLLQGIDRLFYDPDILIEHMHWIVGKAVCDENYRFVYGPEQQAYGRMITDEYLSGQVKRDVDKLKEAISKESSGDTADTSAAG
jgi:hypothetical protein